MIQVVYVLIFILIESVYCSSVCKDSWGLAGCDLLPPDDQCGEVRPAPRVVGGENAKLGQFPWATVLYGYSTEIASNIPVRSLPSFAFRKATTAVRQWLSGRHEELVCGASVISERYVITAAHCCVGNSIVSVRVGEHDLGSTKDCEAGRCAPPPQDIPIERYVVHKDYDVHKVLHDVCLLRLKRSISFNEFVGPICLPTSKYFQNNTYEGQYLEVAGWGITKFHGAYGVYTEILQTTSLKVVPLRECMKTTLAGGIRKPELCAGGEGGRDSCKGDSGGPLMGRMSDTSNSSQRYYLVGIVSYGGDTCSGDFPGAYVDVSKYIDWIVNNMALMEEEK